MLGKISISRHSCYWKRDLSGLFLADHMSQQTGNQECWSPYRVICVSIERTWTESRVPEKDHIKCVLKEAGRNRMEGEDECLWTVTVGSSQTKCKPDHLRGKEWHQILEFLSQRVGCSWPWVATWAVRTMRIADSVTLRWMCTGWITWKHWGGKPRLEPWRTERIWISSDGYIRLSDKDCQRKVLDVIM